MSSTRRVFALILAFAAGAAAYSAQAAVDPAFDGASEGKAPRAAEQVKKTSGEVPKTGVPTRVDPRMWVVIRAGSREERTRLAEAGVSIADVEGGRVSGIADPESLQRVRRAGFEIVEAKPLRPVGPEEFPSGDEAYHDYGEVAAELSAIASSNPDIATVFSIGQGHQGNAILALRFHVDEGYAKPGAVFMGTHHAREHLSTEVVLLTARWLSDNRYDPGVWALLASRDVYFIPVVNPDGAEYDIASGRYQYQRKNMRDNGDGSTGVDLNRNYGYGWGGAGASGYPRSDTYRGPSAFSEPESRAVRDFILARPNIRTAVTYHSYGSLILYPWSHSYDSIPDGRALGAYKAMAASMSSMTGYEGKQSSDLYASSGDTCDWAWAEAGVFCFTFELPPSGGWGGFYPGPEIIGPTVDENVGPVLYLIDLADDPYRAANGKLAAKK